MKLQSYQVFNYKNIDDSGEITVDPKVTCFVGKNEAGKTALLQALYRFNPIDEADFDEVKDYPRKRLNAYQRKVKSGKESSAEVLHLSFKLDQEDVEAISADNGDCVKAESLLEVTHKYDGSRTIGLKVDEKSWIRNYISSKGITNELIADIKSINEISELITKLDNGEEGPEAAAWISELTKIQEKGLTIHVWGTVLKERLPKIFFFDDYKIMTGSASLNEIASSISPGIITLKELLDLAGVTPRELQDNSNYEHHKASLEATANEITDDVFNYWKQNTQLEVEFDVHHPQNGSQEAVFHVRIKNNKHRVTVPFDERSRGFVWFFSFLTAFKKLSEDNDNVIILLDEPGLNLHASAQADLLRFIEEILSEEHQVIYSTHSPFMIDAQNLDRVRTVEDLDSEGVKVSSECLSVDHNTVFPLQAAMGYSLAQTLFLGPNCLLVEGPSDLLYLQVMSTILEEKGKEPLSDKWVITPVGGADKLGTFATLIGSNNLNICVLMDIAKKDKQRINNLVNNDRLNRKSIIEVNQFTGNDDADIEDLFSDDEYISFVKDAYPSVDKTLASDQLGQQPRIIKRIESFMKKEKGKFNHYKPSKSALAILTADNISDETVDRFDAMFKAINATLKKC